MFYLHTVKPFGIQITILITLDTPPNRNRERHLLFYFVHVIHKIYILKSNPILLQA